MEDAITSAALKGDEICMTCSTHGRDDKFLKNFSYRPEEKIPLGNPENRWEDIIKIDGKYIIFVHSVADICKGVEKKVKLSRYMSWRHMGGEEV
jgi:hypothetical protein